MRHSRLITLFIFILIIGIPGGLNAQDSVDSPWLKGYVKDIKGEILTYHSPHPEATTSLLVRSLNSKQYIEWELEPIPENNNSEIVTFVWMYGIDVNEKRFEYKLYLNDQYLLSFYNPQDTINRSFEIDGKKNSNIIFKPTLVDKYGDFMGYAFFSAPTSLLKKNGPNRIKIIGETKNDRAWYMTFRYGLDSKASANQQPALIRGENGPEYLIRFDIHHFADPDTATIVVKGKKYNEPVHMGLNMVSIHIPVDEDQMEVAAKVTIGNEKMFDEVVMFKPVKQMDIYLIHHTHNDIGYTHVQTEVERMQHEYLEEAIRLAKESKNNPDGSRFRWNTEVMWAVDSYFENADQEKKQELVEAIQNGWIELDGLYANELTALCRQEELIWLTEAGRRISRECDVPMEAAMISDIPGYTWGLVTTMGESGIKYFSVGTNNGHRIGTIMEELSDEPFYWESTDGKFRVLTWVHGKGYSWFHTGLGFQKLRNKLKEKPVFEYVGHLEQTGYPYDMVVVRYNIGSDNGPPDPFLAGHIKSWNEKFISPRVIISTVSEAFGEFEKSYGDQLPVLRGDLTPYWEDGAASSAKETALCRDVAERLVQADIFWTVKNIENYPESLFREAWKNVLLYDEHTWGSWNSISEPEIPFTLQQWEIKKSFVLKADSITKLIFDKMKKSDSKRKKGWEVFDVINTSSWERSGVIYLTAEQSSKGDKVIDENDNYIQTQRLTTGELAVSIQSVPPLGAKRFHIQSIKNPAIPIERIGAPEISDANFRMVLDEETANIISITDKKTGFELVDNTSINGFDQYYYVKGRDPGKVVEPKMSKFRVKEYGDLIKSVWIRSDALGCKYLDRVITLVEPEQRLEIMNILDRENVYNPEGIHFAFPFNVPDGEVRIDVGFGYFIPEKQQLAGSNKNFYTPQRWVDVSNNRNGVTWVTRDAPVIELGGINMDATVIGWKTKQEPTSTIYSYAMNNYWETNYKASQPGTSSFHYSIFPHDGFDPSEAEKNAIEICQPLISIPADSSDKTPESLFSLSNDRVIVTLIKSATDKSGKILRLYNTSDKQQHVKINWNALIPKKIHLSNLYEDKLKETKNRFELVPFETITLLVE